jgi:Fe2+ or Zn2+ uptake regulation protein
MDNLIAKKQPDIGDQDLGAAILAYLAERSQAMDTVEGIAEWWLLRQRVIFAVQQVERVLQQLKSREILETVEQGRTTFYRLRRPNAEESAFPVEHNN